VTVRPAHARRLLARRPTVRRWYAALVFLWVVTFGGLALLGAQMMQCAPSGCDSLGQVVRSLSALAAELWPPASLAGALFVLAYWSPVLFAPLGLTRPDHKELY
jgi:hypothetical protein